MHAGRKPDYIRCYRVLSLKAGCSWEQARRHYKLLSQRWHPDRHPDDPVARADAERKQRILNLAMRAITDYHKVHGCMPLRARPKLRQPDGFDFGAEPDPRPGGAAGAGRGRSTLGWLSLVLLVAAVTASWWFWPAAESPRIGTEERVFTGQLRASSDFGLGKAGSRTAKFGFGDTPELVRFVQGNPTSVKGSVWYFGKSMVYFKNGRVAGWLNHVDNPLRTSSELSAAGNKLIHIGSSSKEVSRIQGEPLFKTPSRWEYGPSYIEFRNNRVTGWYNSPLRPLRVAE